MRLTAVLRSTGEDNKSLSGERSGAFDRRRAVRRPLRLSATTSAPLPGDTPVLILDISPGGLLIEADSSSLSVGDRIEIILPDKGPVQVRVAWGAGGFFGCEFSETISAGAISAALLKADPRVAPTNAACEKSSAGRAGFLPELNFSAAFYLSLILWALIGTTIYLLVR